MDFDRDEDHIHYQPDLLNVELPGGRIDVFSNWPATASVACEADLSAKECRMWAGVLLTTAALLDATAMKRKPRENVE